MQLIIVLFIIDISSIIYSYLSNYGILQVILTLPVNSLSEVMFFLIFFLLLLLLGVAIVLPPFTLMFFLQQLKESFSSFLLGGVILFFLLTYIEIAFYILYGTKFIKFNVLLFCFMILLVVKKIYESEPEQIDTVKLFVFTSMLIISLFIITMRKESIVDIFKLIKFQRELELYYKGYRGNLKYLKGSLILQTNSFIYIQPQDNKAQIIAIPINNILRMEFEKEEQKKTK